MSERFFARFINTRQSATNQRQHGWYLGRSGEIELKTQIFTPSTGWLVGWYFSDGWRRSGCLVGVVSAVR